MKESGAENLQAVENNSAKRQWDAPKGWGKLSAVSLMFFTISFLGWCLEVITCSSGFKYFSDRGFLTLPFCVIYGTPLCLIFLILGTPREGVLANVIEKTRLRKAGKIFLRYFLYFLLSAAIANIVLWIAVVADFSFNMGYLLREGHHFDLAFRWFSAFF